jgi:hypothetical protein
MKKMVKISFIIISMGMMATSHAGLLDDLFGDNIYYQTILDNEKVQPADFQYSIPRTTWSQNLKKLTVNYTMFVRPEDKKVSKHPFLFYRLCSRPNEFWLYGVDQPMVESRQWKKDTSGETPLPYAVYSINDKRATNFLLDPGVNISSYQMSTGEPIDLSSLAGKESTDCAELFAGYGLGREPANAYKDMLEQNRFEMVFSTVKGIQALGGYKLEVKSIGYTDFKRRLTPALCSSFLQKEIGCPD